MTCLTLLADHAPGLAPRPLRREDGDTPVIVMERIPGEPLAPRPLATEQTLALGAALRAYVEAPPVPEPRHTAIGIADLNPANVLWDGRRARLVDFEDGGLSDPAYELADHVEHLGSRLPGVYDVRALPDAVGLDAEGWERMEAYRAAQPARHHRAPEQAPPGTPRRDRTGHPGVSTTTHQG